VIAALLIVLVLLVVTTYDESRLAVMGEA